MRKLILAGLLTLAYSGSSMAASAVPANTEYDIPKCNKPPFGDSEAAYKAFMIDLAEKIPLHDPAGMLHSICNAKFGHADRTPLHNLGITDAEIAQKGTVDLAIDMISAINNMPNDGSQ